MKLQFLETGHELGNHYNEVIAPQDVATYGGLCALASFDRMELKAYILSFLGLSFPLFFNDFLFRSRVLFLSKRFYLTEQSYRQPELPEFFRVST